MNNAEGEEKKSQQSDHMRTWPESEILKNDYFFERIW